MTFHGWTPAFRRPHAIDRRFPPPPLPPVRPPSGISTLPCLPSHLPALTDHVDRFLGHRVEGRHSLGVRLKRALRHDQVCELGGDVYVGLLQRVIFDESRARPLPAHPRWPHRMTSMSGSCCRRRSSAPPHWLPRQPRSGPRSASARSRRPPRSRPPNPPRSSCMSRWQIHPACSPSPWMCPPSARSAARQCRVV